MAKKKVDIFSYYEYRKYLRDIYEVMHEADDRFSYRYIQNKIGLDPGFLVKIFNGQKHLAEKFIASFAKLLKLNKRESEYFNNLVLFGRAKNDTEIRRYFEKLLSFSELNIRTVDADAYEFYTHWYYTAIREILAYYPFNGNYEELSKMVVPAITITEAKRAITMLEKKGFIEKDEEGIYRQTSKFITSGDLCRNIAVRAFQKDTIELAMKAIGSVPAEERDISTVTITLSESGFNEVKEKLKKTRQEILKIANSEDPNGAYHLNLQLIPIGKRFAGEGNE